MDSHAVFARMKPFLGRNFTGEEREKLAAEFGVSPATISRWKERLDKNPFASALKKMKPGPKVGTSRLPKDVIQIMDEVIDKYYLTKKKPRKRKVYHYLSVVI